MEAKVLTPESILCTSYLIGDRLDYRKLWSDVSEQLQEAVGAAITPPVDPEGELPEANAFDHVRRAAYREGYPAILLLFDEAQLFSLDQ